MWILYAVGSSFFAGITSILAKCGIQKTDSDVATAVRTIVVLLFSWLMVFVTGTMSGIKDISGMTLLFLVLSGLATGASWLCYFHALQKGDINKVVPIDKSSTILTILLALIFLHEGLSWAKAGCVCLIGIGTMMMITRKEETENNESRDGSWLIYAVLSAVFASLTAILGKIGISGIDSNLGTAIRTTVVLVMAWLMVFMKGKQHEVREIEKKVTQAGGILQIAMTDNSVAKERMHLEEFLRTRRIDGLIAEPVKSGLPNPNLDLYQKLQKSGIPVVFVNSFYENLTIPHVSLDDEKAGYLATKHLLECGHTRIAGIFKADDGQGRMRYAGYTKALMEHSLKIKNRQILWVDSEDIREMEMESDRILKRLDGCTACVCYNDEIASKLVKVLQSAEIKVPDQISVIGIDNSSLARFCEVPITSVNNPANEIGKCAAQIILDKIDKNMEMYSAEFAPELVMRNSVKLYNEVM